MKNLLLPVPRTVCWQAGRLAVSLPAAVPVGCAALETIFPGIYRVGTEGQIIFEHDAAIPAEGYCLEVAPDGVRISSAAPAGQFYGLVTLGQLLMDGGELPCCRIEDSPKLPLRGFMLDVSRGRIPTMETLYQLADLLARFKYNHLQLYIEGFSFAYPSFPQCWEGRTPLTPEELRVLDAYCRERFIELAANQNTLGHTAPWLARPEFRSLAEREEGLELFGKTFPPTTLDAANPGSLALVKRMLDDLLPCFTSPWVNVGMDEAFELGKGKNAAYAARHGGGRLFLEYAEKLHEYLSGCGKKMMMWADAAAGSPMLRRELPRDILLLEWGYEAEHPFAERARMLREDGRRFLVCPGTSSWSSFTGITDNMLANVRAAADAAGQWGAEGLLLTDWGDMGHLQMPAASWPALVFAGALAWDWEADVDEELLAQGLDRLVFRDRNCVLGQLVLDMGRYSQWEPFRMACRTAACLPILLGPMPGERYRQAVPRFVQAMARMAPERTASIYLAEWENRQEADPRKLLAGLENLKERLAEARPECGDGPLLLKECRCALNCVGALTRAHDLLLRGEREAGLAGKLAAVVDEYRALWPRRARPDGLEDSLSGFIRLQDYFEGGETR